LVDPSIRSPDWDRLEPTVRRHQTMEAVKALFLNRERTARLLIVVEDLHWADVQTRLLLDVLGEIASQRRMLLITTQRPEAGDWGGRYQDLRIELTPLGEHASHQLLDALAGNDLSLAQIRRRILGRAQGNPLFIEELVRALRDTKVLAGHPGAYRMSKHPQQIDVPETLHSVVASRIDLLAGIPKSLLQTAAILGRDFSVAVLAKLVDMDAEELAPHLERLEAGDFLDKGPRHADAQYSFKHELTRDVAYSTMLSGVRRRFHAKAVEIIETNFSDRLDTHIDRLADHAFHGQLWEKAIPYQLRSCRRAIRAGANQDAINIYERALETLSHLPPSEAKTRAQVDLRLTLIIALEPLGKHRRIAEVLREARSFAEALSEAWRMAAVNCQLAVALWRLGEHDAAMATAEAANVLAAKTGDEALMYAALHHIGIVHHETGALAQAVDIHRRCLALEKREFDEKRAGWAAYPSVVLRTFIADSLVDMGEFEEAEIIAAEAADRASAVDHAYSRANITHVRARVSMALGRHAEALASLQDMWRVCLDLEMIQMYPIFAARLGEAWLGVGNAQAALDIVSVPEKLDVPLAEHAFGWRYLFLAQGRAYLAVGNHAAAEATAFRALRLAESRGERPQQAHAAKLLGDIWAAEGRSVEAERYFRYAVDVAEACGMKPVRDSARAGLAALRLGQIDENRRELEAP
jgi:tetratricopeptide (TPR) repeat protein